MIGIESFPDCAELRTLRRAFEDPLAILAARPRPSQPMKSTGLSHQRPLAIRQRLSQQSNIRRPRPAPPRRRTDPARAHRVRSGRAPGLQNSGHMERRRPLRLRIPRCHHHEHRRAQRADTGAHGRSAARITSGALSAREPARMAGSALRLASHAPQSTYSSNSPRANSRFTSTSLRQRRCATRAHAEVRLRAVRASSSSWLHRCGERLRRRNHPLRPRAVPDRMLGRRVGRR
jgi:hypothetical protein